MLLVHSLIFIVTCVIGWTEPCRKDETSGHCYQIFDTNIRWNQAFDKCKCDGGYLVTIESVEEQQFIADLIPMPNKSFETDGLWIGSNKLHPEHQRSWVNGERFCYVNWAEGEPNSAPNVETCAEIRKSDKKWKGEVCTSLKGYICEKILPVKSESEGTIIGAVVGSLLALVLGVIIFFLIKKRKCNKLIEAVESCVEKPETETELNNVENV